MVRWSASQCASRHVLLKRPTERLSRRLLLYPRSSGGAPPGFVSLFLDSTAEEHVFPLDKVDFTLVLHGTGTPDVTKSAQRDLLVAFQLSEVAHSLYAASSHHFTTSSPDWWVPCMPNASVRD